MIFGENREKTPNSLFLKGFASKIDVWCDFNGNFMFFCYFCVKTLKYAVGTILGMMSWFYNFFCFGHEIIVVAWAYDSKHQNVICFEEQYSNRKAANRDAAGAWICCAPGQEFWVCGGPDLFRFS